MIPIAITNYKELTNLLSLPKSYSTTDNMISYLKEIITAYNDTFSKDDKGYIVNVIGKSLYTEIVDKLNNSHKDLLKTIDNLAKDEHTASEAFREYMKSIEFEDIINHFTFEIKDCYSNWYRIRDIDISNANKETLFHPPISIKPQCARFGLKDKPCLFLSQTEKGCIEEGYKGGDSTIGVFNLNNGYSLNLFDMTSLSFNNEISHFSVSDHELQYRKAYIHLLWPLICASYCIIGKTDESGIKNQYLISQLLSEHINQINSEQKHIKLHGIRYYSCRNENLNPNLNDWTNICLFTNEHNENGYDTYLFNAFKLNNCYAYHKK